MKELTLDTLTAPQKLGLTTIAFFWRDHGENVEYIESLIKNHSLGGVWVAPRNGENEPFMKRFREAADYPLLFFTDAESGFGEHLIGRHNAIGCTGSAELAYAFGKVTASLAREKGYNVVCNPVLDMVNFNCTCGGNIRALGNDKHEVTRLAAAEARGMHDAGVLTVGKHYPGSAKTVQFIDSHMGETASDETAEELLDYNLFPYLELSREGLLDGVMLGHKQFYNIDPDYPISLSKKGIKLFRDHGFEGFAMTDALNMMGVVAKYGRGGSVGLAVANAADLALPFNSDHSEVMTWLGESYESGLITDARLDEAVSRVLAAQHKALVLSENRCEITEADLACISRINTESIYARTDAGLGTALDKNGRHFFAILTETETDLRDNGKVLVDTMKTSWYDPQRIAKKLHTLFPYSTVATICEYPTPDRISRFLSESLDFDDVVFVTFFQSAAYVGRECFTSRIVSLMDAMQVSGRISTVLHFGNPYLLEDLPHIPRILIGTQSAECVDASLEVLAGDRDATGVLTYDVKLK